MSARPVAFVDTETTGLGPDALVWEVAVIRREVDEAEFVLHEFVAGIDPLTADPGALAVGRFFERHPHYASRVVHREAAFGRAPSYELASPRRDVAAAPAEMVARHVRWATRDAVIVGVNPAFDMRVLEKLMRGHGQVPSWYYTPLDMKAFAVGWHSGLGGRAAIDESSYGLSKRCGVEPPSDDAHTALGDARWAQRWFDALEVSA